MWFFKKFNFDLVFFIILNIVFFLLIIVQTNWININIYSQILTWLSIFLFGIAYIWEDKWKSKKFEVIFSNVFLICLWILAFQSIFWQDIFGFNLKNYSFWKTLLEIIKSIEYFIVIYSIVSGSLVFYLNRDKIDIIEDEKNKELEEEEKRWKEFDKKYMKLSKVPILGKICRWGYKEGKWYVIWFLLILLIWSFIRIYNLWKNWLYVDEWYTLMWIIWISEKWIPIMPNDIIYYRGAVFSYISYLIHKIWNINMLLSARLVSSISWIIMIIFSYILWKKFVNKKIWLLLALFISLWLWWIEMSIWARYYSLNALIYILSTYYLYLFINSKKITFLILFFVLSILWIFTHLISIVLFIVWVVILIYFFSNNKKIQFLIWSIIPLIIILILWIRNYINNKQFDFLWVLYRYINKLDFKIFFIDFYINYLIIIIPWIILALSFLVKYNKKKYFFLAIVSSFPLIFVTYYSLHEVSRYIYISYFYIVLMWIYSLYIYSKIYKNMKYYLLVILVFLASFIQYLPESLNIPFRKSGEYYNQKYFAPTSAWTNKIPNDILGYKYLKNYLINEKENYIIITNNFSDYYVYMLKEADYYIRPWKQGFWNNKNWKVYYMKKTLHIWKKEEFDFVIKNNKSYVILNKIRTHQINLEKINTWLSKYDVKVLYEDITMKIILIKNT